MEELRSLWEVPAIAHFCSLFKVAFNLKDFDFEELEEAFLCAGSEEGNEFLTELICSLLRGCYRKNDIDDTNWEYYLADILKYRWTVDSNILEDMKFWEINIQTKVKIVQALCEFRLDADDVQDKLKGFEADGLRLEPLGHDSTGATYWYFYGTRLYMEEPEPPPPEPAPKKNDKKIKGRKKEKDKKKHKKGKHGKKKTDKSKKTKGKTNSKDKKKRGRKPKNPEPESDEDEKESKSKKKKKGKIQNDPEPESDNEVADEQENSVPPAPPMPLPSRWHLVCQTTEDWENLAMKFKGSRTKCERELYKTLIEDFVPEIPKMIEAKEREMRKKLLELAPRRGSSRIQKKQKEQEEHAKLMESIMLEEKKRHEEAEKERQRLLEIQQEEEQRRQREERRLAKEERSMRAKLREERAVYISAGKDIPLELQHVDSPKQDSQMDEMEEELYSGMKKVIEQIRKHKDSWPFWEPVLETYAPGYYDRIKHPMEIATIEEKVRTRKYMSRNSFIDDFRLIFSNCLQYNGPESEYMEMADAVEDCFNKACRRYLPKVNVDRSFQCKSNGIVEKKFLPKRSAGSRALELLQMTAEEDLHSSRSNSPDIEVTDSPAGEEKPPPVLEVSVESNAYKKQTQKWLSLVGVGNSLINKDGSGEGNRQKTTPSILRNTFTSDMTRLNGNVTTGSKTSDTTAHQKVQNSSPFQLLKEKLQEQQAREQQKKSPAKSPGYNVQISRGNIKFVRPVRPTDIPEQQNNRPVSSISFLNNSSSSSLTSSAINIGKLATQLVAVPSSTNSPTVMKLQTTSGQKGQQVMLVPQGAQSKIPGTINANTQPMRTVRLVMDSNQQPHLMTAGTHSQIISTNNLVSSPAHSSSSTPPADSAQHIRQPAKKRKYIPSDGDETPTEPEAPKVKLWRPGLDEELNSNNSNDSTASNISNNSSSKPQTTTSSANVFSHSQILNNTKSVHINANSKPVYLSGQQGHAGPMSAGLIARPLPTRPTVISSPQGPLLTQAGLGTQNVQLVMQSTTNKPTQLLLQKPLSLPQQRHLVPQQNVKYVQLPPGQALYRLAQPQVLYKQPTTSLGQPKMLPAQMLNSNNVTRPY